MALKDFYQSNVVLDNSDRIKEIKNKNEFKDKEEERLSRNLKEGLLIDIHSYGNSNRLEYILKRELIKPMTLEEEMEMEYEDYIVYLLNKYGPAKCDYYMNDLYVSKNPEIERLSEGLFCHHVAEECNVSLSQLMSGDFLKSYAYDLDNHKFFVYGDYLEHLLLHIKIAMEDIYLSNGQQANIDLSGARKIWRELNDYYDTGKTLMAHRKAVEFISHRFEDYILILKWMLTNEEMSKYCSIEKLSVNQNGVVVNKIFDALN